MVIAIVVLCFFQIKKHWKLRQAQAAAAAIVGTSPELVGPLGDVQLYLQHKAELSGERREHDMQAEGDVYELMDHDERQEMSGEDIQQPMLSLGERHELRGEDHARELDTSQDQQDPRRDPNGYSFDEPMFVDFNESVLSLREFT